LSTSSARHQPLKRVEPHMIPGGAEPALAAPLAQNPSPIDPPSGEPVERGDRCVGMLNGDAQRDRSMQPGCMGSARARWALPPSHAYAAAGRTNDHHESTGSPNGDRWADWVLPQAARQPMLGSGTPGIIVR